MLAVIVSKVAAARFPVDCALFLVDSVLEPVESHVHGFAFLLFASVIHHALENFVVSDDGGGWLGMT